MNSCFCPHCYREVAFAASQAGCSLTCPWCDGKVTAPRPPRPSPSPSQPSSPSLRCRCPHCNCTLKLARATVDEIKTCPACGGRFNVPREIVAPVARPVDENRYSVAPDPQGEAKKLSRRPKRYEEEGYPPRRVKGDPERGRIIVQLLAASMWMEFCLIVVGAVLRLAGVIGGAQVNGRGRPDMSDTLFSALISLFTASIYIMTSKKLLNRENSTRVSFGVIELVLGGSCTTLVGLALAIAGFRQGPAPAAGALALALGILHLSRGLALLLLPSVKAYCNQ